jgi:hypothetical protein
MTILKRLIAWLSSLTQSGRHRAEHRLNDEAIRRHRELGKL